MLRAMVLEFLAEYVTKHYIFTRHATCMLEFTNYIFIINLMIEIINVKNLFNFISN